MSQDNITLSIVLSPQDVEKKCIICEFIKSSTNFLSQHNHQLKSCASCREHGTQEHLNKKHKPYDKALYQARYRQKIQTMEKIRCEVCSELVHPYSKKSHLASKRCQMIASLKQSLAVPVPE